MSDPTEAMNPESEPKPEPKPKSGETGTGMDEAAGAGQDPAQNDARQAAFEQAVENFVASLPDDAAKRLLVAAVPHWLEPALLVDLLGEAGAQAASKELPPLRFVQPTTDGRHRIHDAARIVLRRILRRDEAVAWLEANRAAQKHFDALVAAEGDQKRDDARLEAVYHGLVVDGDSGLAGLRQAFEQAFWEHRLGMAERLLSQARELEVEGILGGGASAWLDYFQARLEQAYRRGDRGLAAFETLATSSEALLAAHAGWSRGRALAQSQSWAASINVLRETVEGLGQTGGTAASSEFESIFAHLHTALGESYRDLALRSGGFLGRDESSGQSRLGLVRILRHLPFLIYQRWLRKLAWLPNAWWWLPDGDYQDWIVTHLLERSSSAYRQAAQANDPRVAAEAGLALADIDHKLGRWSRARRGYTALLNDPLVSASPYRRARTDLGLASAKLDEGQDSAAATVLTELQTVFRRHGDAAALALTSQRRGRALAGLGKKDSAALSFVESLQSFEVARDPLGRTEAIREIEDLVDLDHPAYEGLREQMQASTSSHYLARFPAGMLGRFRKLALYVALPPTLILTLVLAMSLVPLVWIVESESRFWASGAAAGTSFVDYLILTGFALLPLIFSLWTYRFIYGLVGLVAVRFLGRDPQRFEREQPDVLVVDEAGLHRHRAGEAVRSMEWASASAWREVDYQTLGQRMPLLSRSTLLGLAQAEARSDASASSSEAADGAALARSAKGADITVEGVTAGYDQLQREVVKQLAKAGKPEAAVASRFDLLAWRWTLGIVLAAFGLSLLAYNSGKIPPIGFESEVIAEEGTVIGDLEVTDLEVTDLDAGESGAEGSAESASSDNPTGGPIDLPLTGLTTLFIPMLLLLFASVTHARMAWHDLALRRSDGLAGSPISRAFLWTAALGWALLTFGWFMFLAGI